MKADLPARAAPLRGPSPGAGPGSADARTDAALVVVEDLAREFDVSRPLLERLLSGAGRRVVKAVDGVSFTVARGTTLALVGESGCGKSTVARVMAGLYRPSRGRVLFDGQDVHSHTDARAAARLRPRIQMIFQDPYASLNPRWRVEDIVGEPIRLQSPGTASAERRERVEAVLHSVGLAATDRLKFPHQFSGGQRQRLSIARALAGELEFLVCDEPTSALDVSVQAQILNILKGLQEERGLSYLFISHNLAAVRYISDTIGVMYLGRLVEVAPKRALFAAPLHPYTQLLLDAVPALRGPARPRSAPAGELPDPLDPPSGCAFHPRCALATDRCRTEAPVLRVFGPGAVACHAVEEGRA
jgi:peptide/nickel transport system ATP-binding protein